jgi:hypothetical protein
MTKIERTQANNERVQCGEASLRKYRTEKKAQLDNEYSGQRSKKLKVSK